MKVVDLLCHIFIWGLFCSLALSCEGKGHYQAPDYVSTERLLLQRIRIASQEIQGYQDTVFKDNPQAEGRETNWKTIEKIIEIATAKEETGYYNIVSFYDYNIYLQGDGDIIGRFAFLKEVKNRIETMTYISQPFRQQEFEPEVIKGIIQHVISPGLNLPYCVASVSESGLSGETIIPHLEGVYAQCYLTDYVPIAAYHDGGFKVRLSAKKKVLMAYPSEGRFFLSDDEVLSLKVISEMQDKVFKVPEEMSAEQVEEIKGSFVRLLGTNESLSLLCGLELLRSQPFEIIEESQLKEIIPSDKSTLLSEFVRKEEWKKLWMTGAYFADVKKEYLDGLLTYLPSPIQNPLSLERNRAPATKRQPGGTRKIFIKDKQNFASNIKRQPGEPRNFIIKSSLSIDSK